MISTQKGTPRLLPSADMPSYTFVPGAGSPHPTRDPKGHSFTKKIPHPTALDPDAWAESRTYLFAIDLFNSGFYWEAHEEWERLWRASGAETMVGRFLKGLIKLAAAGVKVRERSVHGVRRHAASAGEVFADVAAEADADYFCGLEFTHLQYAADRAAQLAYKHQYAAGEPARVFPFIIQPYPSPLT